MKKLVLIDGHALLHRAFHAIPPLTTKKGELINAVFGFSNMLLKILSDLKPEYLAVCFDRPTPTFRHKEYPKYQAQRPPMAEELKSQIERVREVIRSFKIPIYEKDGFEADDLIGSLAKQASGNIEVVIVTGDKDIFQLITDKVKVYAPKKGLSNPEMVDREKFREKYGFEPEQLVDFKALVGDPSDNYPGVSGIGPKTAVKLVQKYGSLEEIYKHLEEIEPKVAEKLKRGKETAFLSYKLAKIVKDAPVRLDWEKCRFGKYDSKEVKKVFEKLEFKSLVKRLPGMERQKEKQMKLI